ncbi:MAG: C40 family peptidase [Lachnospiraceae bacterium]|nr:C40 family peptidase [Lachnospiraceae bacterium]
MAKAKVSEFTKFIRSKVGCAYLWGGQGESLFSLMRKLAKQNGQSDTKTEQMISFMKSKGIKDMEVFDCSGLGVTPLLAMGAISGDMTADGFYRKCKKISKNEVREGDMTFLLNASGKATHIGYMVDRKTVVHALNQSRGVIEEDVNKRKWVFGRPEFCLEYDLEQDVKEENKKETTEYFEKYTGTSGSIVDGLAAVGAKSNFSYRKEVATANGITNYSGVGTQNKTMLDLLKEGKLIKP